MDETIGVEVDQSQCYVVADVELKVVGQWSWGVLQECSQTFITKFHEENRQLGVSVRVGTQVLDNIGVSDQAQ